MEAKFKVGDVVRLIDNPSPYQQIGIQGEIVSERDDGTFLVDYSPHKAGQCVEKAQDLNLVTPAQPAIKIGSTWYWQGEKDSPVTVIGFDSKGRVVVESGFEDKDGDPVYFGEVFSYGGNAGIEGTDMFLEAY